jgi:hypothetical protein
MNLGVKNQNWNLNSSVSQGNPLPYIGNPEVVCPFFFQKTSNGCGIGPIGKCFEHHQDFGVGLELFFNLLEVVSQGGQMNF